MMRRAGRDELTDRPGRRLHRRCRLAACFRRNRLCQRDDVRLAAQMLLERATGRIVVSLCAPYRLEVPRVPMRQIVPGCLALFGSAVADLGHRNVDQPVSAAPVLVDADFQNFHGVSSPNQQCWPAASRPGFIGASVAMKIDSSCGSQIAGVPHLLAHAIADHQIEDLLAFLAAHPALGDVNEHIDAAGGVELAAGSAALRSVAWRIELPSPT